jgi:hypothetical protein
MTVSVCGQPRRAGVETVSDAWSGLLRDPWAHLSADRRAEP